MFIIKNSRGLAAVKMLSFNERLRTDESGGFYSDLVPIELGSSAAVLRLLASSRRVIN